MTCVYDVLAKLIVLPPFICERRLVTLDATDVHATAVVHVPDIPTVDMPMGHSMVSPAVPRDEIASQSSTSVSEPQGTHDALDIEDSGVLVDFGQHA